MARNDPWAIIDPNRDRARTPARAIDAPTASPPAGAVAPEARRGPRSRSAPGVSRVVEMDGALVEQILRWQNKRPLGVAIYAIWMWALCAMALIGMVYLIAFVLPRPAGGGSAIVGAAMAFGLIGVFVIITGRAAWRFWKGEPSGWAWVFILTAMAGVSAVLEMAAMQIQAGNGQPPARPMSHFMVIYIARIAVSASLIAYLCSVPVRAFCGLAPPGQMRAVVRKMTPWMVFFTIVQIVRLIP